VDGTVAGKATRRFVPVRDFALDSSANCYFNSSNMAMNTQFSIAVHIMAGLASAAPREVPSWEIASSVNTNSAFVRRILAKLSKAGLVQTAKGKGGACWLGRSARRISLLDIYRAVDAQKAFSIHRYPAQSLCKVSCGIKVVLGQVLDDVQTAMEKRLAQKSVAELLNELKAS
jgi:Rrf2 family protein